MFRCPYCNEEQNYPMRLRGKKLCVECFWEYGAIFDGWNTRAIDACSFTPKKTEEELLTEELEKMYNDDREA